MALPERFSEQEVARSADLTAVQWWRGFNDPLLNDLMRRGLDQNLSVLQAVERVRAAEAVVRASGTTLNVDGTGEAEYRDTTDTSSVTETSIGLGASWLLDIFGGSRRQREADIARLEQAYAEEDLARIVLLSSLATAYVDLRFFEEQIALRQKDLRSRRETVNRTQSLLDAGNATRLDLTQAQALVSTTQADIPLQQANFVRQANRIATLLGQPAGSMVAELRSGGGQPVPSINIAAGVPADLVRNRPDVRSAERAYAAAVAEIGVAEAQLYPSVSLLGNIEAIDLDGNSFGSWSFGPTLRIPIFNQGRLQANVDVAESRAREQYLGWKASVLTGVEEVENALFSVGQAARSVEAAGRAVRQNEQAVDFSLQLSANRQVTILDLIETERRVAAARTTLAANTRELSTQFIALNVALGAGYEAEPGETVSSATTGPTPMPRPQSQAARTHTVAAGETLDDIAARYDMNVTELAAHNRADPTTLRVGQILTLPDA